MDDSLCIVKDFFNIPRPGVSEMEIVMEMKIDIGEVGEDKVEFFINFLKKSMLVEYFPSFPEIREDLARHYIIYKFKIHVSKMCTNKEPLEVSGKTFKSIDEFVAAGGEVSE